MKKLHFIKSVILTVSGMMLICCNSPRVLTNSVQTAGFFEGGLTSRVLDTVLFHDTVRVIVRNIGDTVFVDRQQIRYVERFHIRTDTVTSIRSDTVRITSKPEPTARSKLTDWSSRGFVKQFSGFLQIAGVIFIILLIIKIRLL